MYENSDGIRRLLLSQTGNLDEDLIAWQNAPYDKCPYHPEALIVESKCGIMTRSKTEAEYCDLYTAHEVPFHYEQGIQLGWKKFYPDFTVRHPRTGEIFLVEHFGLMDNASYCWKAYQKVLHYMRFGFFPGKNLLLSFEDRQHPVNYRKIEADIEFYFLG